MQGLSGFSHSVTNFICGKNTPAMSRKNLKVKFLFFFFISSIHSSGTLRYYSTNIFFCNRLQKNYAGKLSKSDLPLIHVRDKEII